MNIKNIDQHYGKLSLEIPPVVCLDKVQKEKSKRKVKNSLNFPNSSSSHKFKFFSFPHFSSFPKITFKESKVVQGRIQELGFGGPMQRSPMF